MTPKKRAGTAKLGVIGRRKDASQSKQSDRTGVKDNCHRGSPGPEESKGMMASEHAQTVEMEDARGRSAIKAEVTQMTEVKPSQTETSQDRANRRRDDLKRQLAASAGGALKKKRRF